MIDADFKTQVEGVMKPLVEKAMAIKIKQDRYAGYAAALAEASTQILSKITLNQLKGHL